MRKNHIRMTAIEAALILAAGALIFQLYRILRDNEAIAASGRQGRYTLTVPLSTGTIYDHTFIPLTNDETTWYAVVNPTQDAIAAIFSKIRDHENLTKQLQQNTPFCCALTDNQVENANVRVLEGKSTAKGMEIAQHVVGYRQNGVGVAGLEGAYADWLAACDTSATVTFSVDAFGSVLAGLDSSTILSGTQGGGVVTSLDKPIQRITEVALRKAEPNPAGAVVLDAQTGGILAMASLPSYSSSDLAAAMEAENAPFLNRTLCAYSVGSVFKLVVAATALENGFTPDYMYECTGQTEVYGQRFRCHKSVGHGLLNMRSALVGSCNPYFISLSRILSADMLHDTASSLGFGEEIWLADGIVSTSGYLQAAKELNIEAEKANFSFGQGKLLASPLQIAAMTACIADDGIYHTPWLLRGLTEDGESILHEMEHGSKRVLQQETAKCLQEMMYAVLNEGENPLGAPNNTTAGGKTSTAQTGQYDENGKELCHAWMTGFFPTENPRYAVTVFVENGGSGNQAAAPIFRDIIEHIAAMESN